MPGEKYSKEFKERALKMLHVTGSMVETCESMGLHRNTLRLWKREQGIDMIKATPKKKKAHKKENVKIVNLAIEDLPATTKKELSEEITKLKMLVIEQIKEVLPISMNIDHLQKTLRTLYEIGEFYNPDSKQNQNYLFIQNLTQKFKDHESEDTITLDGDTEE